MKKEVILGTAGHVDHGKTSLVKALTGVDTDRLKEEKERGITIELGFAHLDLPCGIRLGIVDVPGHERFVKNMVAGAGGMDLVVMIIAADEGIMPQTREHLEICSLLGLAHGLVVVTKKDMVDADWLELVESEVADFVAGTFLEGRPVIPVSSVTGEGLPELLSALDQLVRGMTLAEASGPFRLPVDRVFTMKGFGTVVTGTAISGRIRTGEPVAILPSGLAARIRGIQVHGEEAAEAVAGARTAINLQGVDKEAIHRGEVVATPGTLVPSRILDAVFLLLSRHKKSLKSRTRIRVHVGTDEVLARMVLLETEELAPGESAPVQLFLERPVAVWPGDRYVVRSYSPVTTLGGGVIESTAPRRRRRFRAGNLEAFALYRQGVTEELARFHLREAGVNGLTHEELAVRLALFGKKLARLLDPAVGSRRIVVVSGERQRLLDASVYADLKTRAAEALAVFHRDSPLKPGISKEELRYRLSPKLDGRIFQFLLQELTQAGTVAVDGADVRLASHRVSLKEDEEGFRQALATLYREAGLAPPTLKEAQAALAQVPPQSFKEMLEVLFREGTLVKVKEDLFYHHAPLADIHQRLAGFLKEHGEIDAGGFKELSGLTRKFSIPLLEYFDRIKLTIRVGDKRVLRAG
ncbi:MAG: selenocysteine-specific translation elongation factor [Thermodesulfobacteriota bacterium]